MFSSAASASIADNSHDVTSTNIGIETRITTNESEQSYPAIYENKIVWTDKRNGNWDIYMYDISTSKEKRITSNSSDSVWPAIYGNKIVWMDNRNGDYYYDIYMYDISTSTEKRITTGGSNHQEPAIYGNTVLHQLDREII